jgi:hypothetical protein
MSLSDVVVPKAWKGENILSLLGIEPRFLGRLTPLLVSILAALFAGKTLGKISQHVGHVRSHDRIHVPQEMELGARLSVE